MNIVLDAKKAKDLMFSDSQIHAFQL